MVLRHDGVLVVVCVSVSRAVTQLFHQTSGGVPDVKGHALALGCARVRGGAAVSLVQSVRLGRGRQVDDRLRQRESALGHPDEVDRLLGGNRLLDRARIGEPHVLDRRAHQTASDVERILPRFEHPGQPVE